MASDPGENTAYREPFFVVSPENFRLVMQRQIQKAVTREVDGVFRFSKNANGGASDGRFSNSNPTPVLAMSNAQGFQYFVVGQSIVGKLNVAAP